MGLLPETVVQVLLRERTRLSAVAAAVVRDAHAADDVFQQVVVAALEGRDQFRGPDHLFAWAVRAARHRAVDAARGRRLRLLSDEVLDLLDGEWLDPAGPPISDQEEALQLCMEVLAQPARELLHLRYEAGLSTPAIARRLGRSADGVYHSLSRVYRALRECVERRLHRASVHAEATTQ